MQDTLAIGWATIERLRPLWIPLLSIAALPIVLSTIQAMTTPEHGADWQEYVGSAFGFFLWLILTTSVLRAVHNPERDFWPYRLGRDEWSIFLAFVCLGIVTLAPGVLMMSLVSLAPIVTSMFAGLTIVIMFVILPRLFLLCPLIVCQSMGAMDAIVGSWRMTKSYMLKILGLNILMLAPFGAIQYATVLFAGEDSIGLNPDFLYR